MRPVIDSSILAFEVESYIEDGKTYYRGQYICSFYCDQGYSSLSVNLEGGTAICSASNSSSAVVAATDLAQYQTQYKEQVTLTITKISTLDWYGQLRVTVDGAASDAVMLQCVLNPRVSFFWRNGVIKCVYNEESGDSIDWYRVGTSKRLNTGYPNATEFVFNYGGDPGNIPVIARSRKGYLIQGSIEIPEDQVVETEYLEDASATLLGDKVVIEYVQKEIYAQLDGVDIKNYSLEVDMGTYGGIQLTEGKIYYCYYEEQFVGKAKVTETIYGDELAVLQTSSWSIPDYISVDNSESGYLTVYKDGNYSIFCFAGDLVDLYRNNKLIAKNIPSPYEDAATEPGVPYVYSLRTYEGNSYSNKELDSIIYTMDDMLLSTLDKDVRIVYNNDLTSYKYNYADSVTPTLGGAYPIVRRNGKQKYRTFQIGGLISYNIEKDYGGYGGGSSSLFQPGSSNSGSAAASDRSLISQSEIDAYTNYDPYDRERILERIYRDRLIEFLHSPQPRLFKSFAEGGMIVRLSNVSLTGNKQLDRNIYSFTATVTEIDEFTNENLRKHNLIQASVNNDPRLAINEYVLDAVSYSNSEVTIDNNDGSLIFTKVSTEV